MNRLAKMTLCFVGTLPIAATAQQFGPAVGDREFSISGTGSNDRSFDRGNAGVTGEMGWYTRENMVWGVRQSINYASIEGESIVDDYWNGSTRGYLNYQFGENRSKPFVGASLGGVYGDGIDNSGFGGLELGIKYYVQTKTYILARMEYQWFFDRSSDADAAFRDGAFAHTVGVGYNF